MIPHLKSQFTKNEMTQEGALTLLALYDPYRTNMAHEQQLMS